MAGDGAKPEGMPPTQTPVGDMAWSKVAELTDDDMLSVPLRASDALKCARQIGFRLFSQPADLVDDWRPERRAAGDAIDRTVKRVLADEFGAAVDVHFDLLPEVRLGGIGDAITTTPLGSTAVEIKTSTTKKLMGLLGNWRSVPAGPEHAWIVQAGLLAMAQNCAAVQVIFFAQDDRTRPPAEWLIGMDDPLLNQTAVGYDDESGEPVFETPRQAALREARRQQSILTAVEAGRLPRREIPGYGIVEYPPPKGDAGDPWACRYCVWQPTCGRLGSGAVADFAGVAA